MKSAMIFFVLGLSTCAQSQTMTVEEYEPVSTLVVPETILTRAKYPFIDVHRHHFEVMDAQDLDSLAADMDKVNLAVFVNLSGRGRSIFFRSRSEADNDVLETSLKNINASKHRNRFILFTNIRFSDIDDPDWSKRTVQRLERDVKLGARGLKIYKDLGLTVKDKSGKRIAVDDPRFDPVWEKCGELGIPVLIHSGEPLSFWKPKDKYNERWLELKMFPNRYRDPKINPSWEQVMTEHTNIMRRHPNTIFISAHMTWMANDLARLGKLLDEIPNMYVELAAIIYEIGRQPRFAREWFIKYQDRILFGKDIVHSLDEYSVYFRVLETPDEYFKYYRKRHAFWGMYGMQLPDEVLKKVYYKNALKIIPGIDASLFGE